MMEDAGTQPDAPITPATPLQPASSDRVNSQLGVSAQQQQQRDGDVHDKIRQFNNLSHLTPGGTASMSKQLERMTADAALKRAMLGREEAESEMRRYREEARALRKLVEEGRERERRVGERLETVMENYGRAKETYSHTQTVWEKEIRRARKETFKSQSNIVKLQEELKAARASLKSAEECLTHEKEVSKAREQEAFAGRYQLAALQDELGKAQDRIRALEEERDAAKAAAKNEDATKTAAQEHRSTPPKEEPMTVFGSPRREAGSRDSLSTFEIVPSAETAGEMEELTRLWQWEKQRADRTQDHLEFVKAEFELFSSRRKSTMRRSMTATAPRKERTSTTATNPIAIVDPASDPLILGNSAERLRTASPTTITQEETPAKPDSPKNQEATESSSSITVARRREPRRGTIFVPSEGIFRTLSSQDLEAMEQQQQQEQPTTRLPHPPSPSPELLQDQERRFTRTPSAEPPTFAMTTVGKRTSLLSLLNAPRQSEEPMDLDIPTQSAADFSDHNNTPEHENSESHEPDSRPQQTFYTVTKTTTVPIQDDTRPPHHPHHVQGHRTPSFDVNNPALNPTMTREEALAQIRERRGRARSGAQTPRKQTSVGVTDRNVSAPAGTTTTTMSSTSTSSTKSGRSS